MIPFRKYFLENLLEKYDDELFHKKKDKKSVALKAYSKMMSGTLLKGSYGEACKNDSTDQQECKNPN